MVFIIPGILHKELSPTTVKIYTNRLNQLAVAGHDTVEKLEQNQAEVIEVIKTLTDYTESGKMRARQYISAISWVTGPDFVSLRKNKYYSFYQTILPGTTVDGDKWVRKSKFKKDK